MKKILFALFLFASFSLSAQTIKKLDDGTLVEVNTYETPITLASIDARIKGYESIIELHKKELEKLYALRKEVEAAEGMKAKALKKGKKK
jgi:hypothetical protein